MKLVDRVPRAVVLGNYETWSNADSWLVEFDRLNVDVMENGHFIGNCRTCCVEV